MIKCTERSGVYQAVKRLFDILASLAALAVLSPLFLVIAILILSEDGRPVFYKHTRVGKGGKTFQISNNHGHVNGWIGKKCIYGLVVEKF